MAQVYTGKNSDSLMNREANDAEASKVDEQVDFTHPTEKVQESKQSDDNDEGANNVIRVFDGNHEDSKEDDSQDSDMKDDDQSASDGDSQHGNERKSNEYEPSQTDSTGNVLRRSERNAKNHQSSYNAFNRRSFKYDDDFEYGGNLASKKGGIEMDPPGTLASNKRRRKANALMSTPFNEGLKRSVSTKTPSTHATLVTSENNGIIYNQGRWT